jgi:hypothetical protein
MIFAPLLFYIFLVGGGGGSALYKTCVQYCTILQLYMFVLHDCHFWDLFGLCVFVARVALDDVWDSRF